MKEISKILLLLFCIAIISSSVFSACQAEVPAGSPGTDEAVSVPGEGTKPEDSGGQKFDEKPEFIINETEDQITVIDPLDNEVTLDKKPEKVAVLMNSILDLWYLAGGTAIARVDGTENVPPEAEGLEILGSVGSPNIERIIALQPDLVIMTSTMSGHRDMKDILEQNNIQYLYVNYRVYDDFIDYLDLFTRITGREDIFTGNISDIKNNVSNTIKEVSGEQAPKILILFASSKSVTCELTTGLVGDMANMLGVANIVGDIGMDGATRVDFSMERIVERDPDYILITTMGDVEECKERVREDIESNQAWAGLRAVKEGKMFYLPKDLYIYKPNGRYPEAVENLAKILYPGVYGK